MVKLVHGQGVNQTLAAVNQTLAAVNCDKVAHTSEFDVGCQYGVHDCSHKIKYNDQPIKGSDKDYTAGYKYGWANEGCPPH